jgi:hypothetical protein
MKLFKIGLAAVLSLVALGAAVPEAAAQSFDRYRGYRYYDGRDRQEIRQRQILRSRMFDLADRIRLAEREGAITRRKANDLFDDLDDVRDFLRDDRHLSDSEFRRRMDDLDDVARDFREALRRQGRRGWDRYDRYDRYDDRYRRDRYYR